MPKYNVETDIPDLKGKVILITGGTAGIGAQTVTTLSSRSPSQIFFTGRSTSRAETLIQDLKSKYPSVPVTFLEIDLASLSSVHEGVQKFLSSSPRLDILICNAGIMALPPGLTEDSYELQFGTNFLSHALLVKLLLPTLLNTAKAPDADVRVVFLSSLAFSGHPLGGIHFDTLKTPQSHFLIGGPWQRYGQSKLALILYASELSRRYANSGILFLSIHPGTFNTELIQKLGVLNKALVWISNAGNVRDETKEGEGAWNVCWAATGSREGVENGGFYIPVGVKGRVFRENSNVELAGRLWEWSETQLERWE